MIVTDNVIATAHHCIHEVIVLTLSNKIVNVLKTGCFPVCKAGTPATIFPQDNIQVQVQTRLAIMKDPSTGTFDNLAFQHKQSARLPR